MNPDDFEQIAIDTCEACALASDRHVLHRAVEAALVRAYISGLREASYLTTAPLHIIRRVRAVEKETGIKS